MTVNVLVVGAGPSGLALALLLLRNGLSVRIIEKEEKFIVGQRGCGLMPRTLEIYKLLGLLPEVLAMARPAPPVQLYSSPQGDAPIKTMELNETMADTPFYPYINPLILGQDRHEALLRKHLLEEYNVTVELCTQLVSLEQHPDHVTAHIKKVINRNEEVPETAVFDWMVGADGAHSIVRKELGIPFLGITREAELLVVGDIRIKKGLENRKLWPFWGNNWLEKMVAMRPFEIEDDDRFNFMIGGSEIDHAKTASSREELIKTFYEVSGRTDVEFGDLQWMGLWRPNIRMVDRFGEGRVFIVGDAAHVHTPAGGQGMNASIQDSFNLAWKLALVHKGLSPMNILESYTKERLPVVGFMLNNTTVVYDTSIKLGNDGRGLTRDFELRQLGVNYRGSPIIFDERYADEATPSDPYRSGDDGLVRSGDRAPEAPGLVPVDDSSTTMTLFDILSPAQHTLLIFSDSSDDKDAYLSISTAFAEKTIQTIVIHPQSTPKTFDSMMTKPPCRVFVDSEGYAFKHYNITDRGTTVFVIRPDGYIGAYARDRGKIVAYFSNIFVPPPGTLST